MPAHEKCTGRAQRRADGGANRTINDTEKCARTERQHRARNEQNRCYNVNADEHNRGPRPEFADPIQRLLQQDRDVEVFGGHRQGEDHAGVEQPLPAEAGLGRSGRD